MRRPPVHGGSSAAALLLTAVSLVLRCQAQPSTIETEIIKSAAQILSARAEQSSPSRQNEITAQSRASTSLIDLTSVPDCFGFALNLAAFAGNGNDSSAYSCGTVSMTPYALFASATGNNALNPEFYSRYSRLRRMSFTYGYDAPERESSGGYRKIYGMKFLIVNGRDAGDPAHGKLLDSLSSHLIAAGAAFGRIKHELQNYLVRHVIDCRGGALIAFLDSLDEVDGFYCRVVASLSSREQDSVTGIISREILQFGEIKNVVATAVDEIRNAGQLALSCTVRKRGAAAEEVAAGLLADAGAGKEFRVSGNILYLSHEDPAGGRMNGGRGAAGFRWSASGDDGLIPVSPVCVGLEAAGSWLSGAPPVYEWALKGTLQITRGIASPVEIIWSDESGEVRFSVRCGFTFDFAAFSTMR